VSRWFGLKVRKKDLVPISAWRCGRCGYLESYAQPGWTDRAAGFRDDRHWRIARIVRMSVFRL